MIDGPCLIASRYQIEGGSGTFRSILAGAASLEQVEARPGAGRACVLLGQLPGRALST
jgi:hypothetical protein